MKISRRFPWTLWPNSICPSFIENPALNQLKGDELFYIEDEQLLDRLRKQLKYVKPKEK